MKTIKINKFVNILVFSMMLNSILSWEKHIHSMIGHIAETKLREKHPSALEKIFKMLAPLKPFLPETENSLIEATAIPIEINKGYFGLLQNFFYIENPLVYWKENNSDVNLPNPNFRFNMTYAMNQTQLIVKQGLDPQHEKTSSIKTGLLDGLMLRYMLTLTGNLHNPVNVVSFYSKDLENKKYINGDNGGINMNVVDVFKNNINNLHDLFSSAFNSFDFKYEELPYSEENIEKIKSQAEYLMRQFPEEYFKNVEDINYLDWQNESYSIAEEFVYSQVELFPVLNPEYIIEGRRISQERITLSGYRLYKLLYEIFERKNSVLSFEEK